MIPTANSSFIVKGAMDKQLHVHIIEDYTVTCVNYWDCITYKS